MNFNKIRLNDYPDSGVIETKINQFDYSTESKGIKVYFRNLKENLIKYIEQCEIIIGCVAWVTDFDILDILATKQVVIVVQKEDFLRPDLNIKHISSWKKQLQQKYNKLSCNKIGIGAFYNILSHHYLNICSWDIKPITCIGNYNRNKKPAFPRMHNKFIICCKRNYDHYNNLICIPKGVWTGSFNFTYNATQSFENALYITDEKIVHAYYEEFGHIASLSEELNWDSDWINPKWEAFKDYEYNG